MTSSTANLRTKILDFRGFDSSIILILRGGNLMSREFPAKFESSNLGRDNLSREIGRRVAVDSASLRQSVHCY